jgi:hypothetical protein
MMTLYIFVQIFLINIFVYSFSNFFYVFFNFENKLNNSLIYEKLLFGYFFISSVGLFINFILPLSLFVGIFFTITGFLITIYSITRFKIIENIKFFFKIIIISFFCFILLFFSQFQEDFPWYSLPFISLISEERISFGISNIQFRFGHISILSYMSGIISNSGFQKTLLSLPYAATVCCFLLISINKILKKKENSLSFNFLFFVNIFCFTKFTRFAEYGNDTPGHILVFYIIYLFIELKEKKNSPFKVSQINKIFFFSIFCIMQKQQLGLIIAIPFYLFIKSYRNFFNLDNIKTLLFIFIITNSWIIKNFINTSCLIYPAHFTCYEKTSWSPKKYSDHSYAKKVNIESSSWAKGWPDQTNKLEHEIYIKEFNWFKTWSKNHLRVILNNIFPFFLISCFIIVLSNFSNLKQINNYQNSKRFFKFFFIYILFSCLIWFITFPTFRYFSSFIISLFIFILIFFLKKQINYKLMKSIVIFSLIFLISKNLFRINTEYKIKNTNYLPDIYRENNINNLKIEKINNFNIIISQEQACKYGKDICTHHGHINNETTWIKKKYGYKFYEPR